MSEKPSMENTEMIGDPGAGAPPPYGMQPMYPAQPGYPAAQPGYPPAQPGYPPTQAWHPQPVMAQPMQQSTNTTIVVNQPAHVVVPQMRDWSSGLCGCFEDCSSLCMGLCFPSCLLCDISSRMGEGCCFATCCTGALLGLRIKLRVQENIQGSLCNDFCLVLWCESCVLCQMARELNFVGGRR